VANSRLLLLYIDLTLEFALRDVRLLGETQYSCVEVERLGLVVNCDACEFDLHDVFVV
jgi:hypothetical protein